ncbi:MAG: 5-(carboxyamino)imidazole ribonucleotide mutase [Candidatus Eisenbacteria bacterium]|uniref:N5-carboxyaminoimidazole ribonucleotide mutase n=1 Tax=Eiseniibacteriota bacterium TaxID=2212470 RepID=A0A948W302_UNCEI|nr:5-(carboxyamino)imidazole ribonucleotide mutase [Candidatus Eisenbacteria bacterium]MBU1951093.1 5-(carboxyamino)imidazole ribonucleotide mutase [Candidatus Eisenbacteria bacterium]MBU2690547.1 5-(carboxyamino)imidazole ribonucleotide mutase [Candidatus Eisenbacteria bacterium]
MTGTQKKTRPAPKSGAKQETKPRVGILYGSVNDESIVVEAIKILEGTFKIPCESKVLSAHRTPDATRTYVKGAKARGIKILIGVAGLAAHLPGVIASYTSLPVLGVPVAGPNLDGMDALLSIVQMPAGVPVGTLGIGKVGARNAALLAARILALENKEIADRLDKLIQHMAEGGRV